MTEEPNFNTMKINARITWQFKFNNNRVTNGILKKNNKKEERTKDWKKGLATDSSWNTVHYTQSLKHDTKIEQKAMEVPKNKKRADREWGDVIITWNTASMVKWPHVLIH